MLRLKVNVGIKWVYWKDRCPNFSSLRYWCHFVVTTQLHQVIKSAPVQIRVQRVTYASSYRERQPCITCWMEEKISDVSSVLYYTNCDELTVSR